MIEPLDEQGDRVLIQTVEPVNRYSGGDRVRLAVSCVE